MSRESSRHPVLFAIFALLASFVLAPSFASAHEAVTGIVASGSGEVRVRPDSLRIVVGVVAQAKTVEEVQRQANEQMQRVLASQRALGIPDLLLQTSILSVLPVHATTPEGVRTAQIVGYSASNAVSVAVRKAPFDKIGAYASAIMNAALEAGANETGGLELFLDDPSSAQAEALVKAVVDARRNGEIMAKAAGVVITGVASVSESEESTPMLARQAPQYEAGGVEAPATPVEAGEIVVSSQVTVRFTLR